MKEIVLASGSPRRKELIRQIGINPKVMPTKFIENDTLPPKEQVIYNAKGKANWVLERVDKDCLIIASDTIVTINNIVLGKPKSKEDAKEMLELLNGKTHYVLTSLYLVDYNSKRIESDVVKTEVFMRKFSDSELNNYINTSEPYDKAGGYAIQGKASIFVTKIEGSYSNVVGLPLAELAHLLSKFNIEVSSAW